MAATRRGGGDDDDDDEDEDKEQQQPGRGTTTTAAASAAARLCVFVCLFSCVFDVYGTAFVAVWPFVFCLQVLGASWIVVKIVVQPWQRSRRRRGSKRVKACVRLIEEIVQSQEEARIKECVRLIEEIVQPLN